MGEIHAGALPPRANALCVRHGHFSNCRHGGCGVCHPLFQWGARAHGVRHGADDLAGGFELGYAFELGRAHWRDLRVDPGQLCRVGVRGHFFAPTGLVRRHPFGAFLCDWAARWFDVVGGCPRHDGDHVRAHLGRLDATGADRGFGANQILIQHQHSVHAVDHWGGDFV